MTWLIVHRGTFGFRVMVPFVGSRLPPMRLSNVDLPMPAIPEA